MKNLTKQKHHNYEIELKSKDIMKKARLGHSIHLKSLLADSFLNGFTIKDYEKPDEAYEMDKEGGLNHKPISGFKQHVVAWSLTNYLLKDAFNEYFKRCLVNHTKKSEWLEITFLTDSNVFAKNIEHSVLMMLDDLSTDFRGKSINYGDFGYEKIVYGRFQYRVRFQLNSGKNFKFYVGKNYTSEICDIPINNEFFEFTEIELSNAIDYGLTIDKSEDDGSKKSAPENYFISLREKQFLEFRTADEVLASIKKRRAAQEKEQKEIEKYKEIQRLSC